ncbi:MAG: hypothetical protein LQ337_006313 [Flavoplaca oasis]|nr:MAG: hypothetical protein LQ337_006313 [Flavoplaca oasis]
MASDSPQAPNLTRPPLTTHSFDEYSPLLQKPTHHDYGDLPVCEQEAPQPDGKALKTINVLWIMTSLWIGTFTAGLDGTVMATLAAPVATSFNSLSLLAWLATAYLIGQAATQPLSGKLTDIFSREWGLVISNCFFALGNIVCGCSNDKYTMIVGRVLAGIGGGCLSSISTIIVSDLIPLRQRALWQGMSNVFWGFGNGLGGLFGGYLNDTWNWRVAFLAQVPLTAACLLIICFQFKNIAAVSPRKIDPSRSSISRVDFLGSVLLVSTLVLFLLGITTGGNIVPWSHPLACVPLPVSFASLAAFLYVEAYIAREPILPLHFLRNRTILCACLTNWFFATVLYIFMFYIPIYYNILGASSTQAGNALVPIGVTLPLGSLIAGYITSRTGRYKYVLWATLVLLVIGAVANSTDTLRTPLWLPLAYLVLVGLANGGMLVVTLVAFTSAVEAAEQAVVTSLSYVFRSTGSVMGVAIGSAVYQLVLERSLWSTIGSIDNAPNVIRSVKDSLEQISTLPAQLQALVRGSYMTALRAAFLTTAGFAVLAVVSGLLVKELKLHSTLTREEDDASVKPDREDGIET